MDASQQAAVQAARDSYGRLLASLAYQWRDIAAAEDALAEAFAAALTHWPRTGVPRSPDAWLTTAAKRNLLQAARHQRVVLDPAVTILLEQDEASADDADDITAIPDERLRLLLVCAHPEIDADVRTPLMLQVVLGLDARQIASALLLKPATLAQRLVRAKARIRDSGLRFELPQAQDLAARSHAVLNAIYGAYALGWHHTALDTPSTHSDLASEALFLAELCARLLPAHAPDDCAASAEALGLLALLRFCEARRDAGLSPAGDFIPLHQQDRKRWDAGLIAQAEADLMQAFTLGKSSACFGPYQLEAAIQSAHCERLHGGAVPWADIARLYEQLLALAPTTGAQLGYAVAVGESQGASAGLALLRNLSADTLVSYQPYWVTRAHLLARTGELAEARRAYAHAIGLTENPAIRRYLMSCNSCAASQ
jgi:RNA polymerase sigma-70 factor (ECF subfamily)